MIKTAARELAKTTKAQKKVRKSVFCMGRMVAVLSEEEKVAQILPEPTKDEGIGEPKDIAFFKVRDTIAPDEQLNIKSLKRETGVLFPNIGGVKKNLADTARYFG